MTNHSSHVAGADIEAMDGRPNPIRFLFEPSSGSIEYATPSGRAWLTTTRRKTVADLVDRADFEDNTAFHVHRDGVRFGLFPMDGALGRRVLVTIAEVDDEPPAASESLTDRQLEVAEYAASGATAPEIADELGVEPPTVYEHLQNIYERLEIGSRAELTRVVLQGEAS